MLLPGCLECRACVGDDRRQRSEVGRALHVAANGCRQAVQRGMLSADVPVQRFKLKQTSALSHAMCCGLLDIVEIPSVVQRGQLCRQIRALCLQLAEHVRWTVQGHVQETALPLRCLHPRLVGSGDGPIHHRHPTISALSVSMRKPWMESILKESRCVRIAITAPIGNEAQHSDVIRGQGECWSEELS